MRKLARVCARTQYDVVSLPPESVETLRAIKNELLAQERRAAQANRRTVSRRLRRKRAQAAQRSVEPPLEQIPVLVGPPMRLARGRVAVV